MTWMALRFSSAMVAVAAWSGVLLQSYLTIGTFVDQGDTVGDGLWRLAGFFTVLTNLMAALTMTAVTFNMWPGGEKPSASFLAAMMLYISVVGVVYHVLLRHVWEPEGLQKIADNILHYVVPISIAAFWVLFAHKDGLKFWHVLLWLLYPLGYCAYALGRGAQDGWYPYPFLDVPTLGLDAVLRNAAWLTIAFAIAGSLLVLLARGIVKRRFSRSNARA